MADLGGVIVGAVLALAGSFGARIWDEWRQRKALRSAFGAEIDGILKITESRGHEAMGESWLSRWEAGEDHLRGYSAWTRYRKTLYSTKTSIK